MVGNSTEVTKTSTNPIVTQAQIITAIFIGSLIITLLILNIVFYVVYHKMLKSYNKKADKNRTMTAMFINQVRPIIGTVVGAQRQELAEGHHSTPSQSAYRKYSRCSETETLSRKMSIAEESVENEESSKSTEAKISQDKTHVKKHVQINAAKGKNESSWPKKGHQTMRSADAKESPTLRSENTKDSHKMPSAGKKGSQIIRSADKKTVTKQSASPLKSPKKPNKDSSAFEISSDFTCVNVKNLRSVRSDSLTIMDIKTIEEIAQIKNSNIPNKMESHMSRSMSAGEGLVNLEGKRPVSVNKREVNTIGKSYFRNTKTSKDHGHPKSIVLTSSLASSGTGSTKHLSSMTVTQGATAVEITDFGQTRIDDNSDSLLSEGHNPNHKGLDLLQVPGEIQSAPSHPEQRKGPYPKGSNSKQKGSLFQISELISIADEENKHQVPSIPGLCAVKCNTSTTVSDASVNTKHPCERNVSTDTINSLEVAIMASQPDNYGEIEIVDNSSLARLKRPRSENDNYPVVEFQNLAFDSSENKQEEYIGDIEL